MYRTQRSNNTSVYYENNIEMPIQRKQEIVPPQSFSRGLYGGFGGKNTWRVGAVPGPSISYGQEQHRPQYPPKYLSSLMMLPSYDDDDSSLSRDQSSSNNDYGFQNEAFLSSYSDPAEEEDSSWMRRFTIYAQPTSEFNDPNNKITFTSTTQRTRCRKWLPAGLIILLIISIATAAALAIYFTVLLTHHIETAHISGTLSFDRTFDEKYNDENDTERISFSNDICSALNATIINSALSYLGQVDSCEVPKFENGSIRAYFLLIFSITNTSITGVTTETIEQMAGESISKDIGDINGHFRNFFPNDTIVVLKISVTRNDGPSTPPSTGAKTTTTVSSLTDISTTTTTQTTTTSTSTSITTANLTAEITTTTTVSDKEATTTKSSSHLTTITESPNERSTTVKKTEGHTPVATTLLPPVVTRTDAEIVSSTTISQSCSCKVLLQSVKQGNSFIKINENTIYHSVNGQGPSKIHIVTFSHETCNAMGEVAHFGNSLNITQFYKNLAEGSVIFAVTHQEIPNKLEESIEEFFGITLKVDAISFAVAKKPGGITEKLSDPDSSPSNLDICVRGESNDRWLQEL